MKKTSKNGFTIIEVSLVLAIAGLIFLMVFVALPGLRASQRDTERRENIISLLDNVKDFQTNNRGGLPDNWSEFREGYLGGSDFMDPSGEEYNLVAINCDANKVDERCNNDELVGTNGLYNAVGFPYNNYTMLIVKLATCRGAEAVRSSNPRKLAVLYKLEGGGVYCNNT